MRRTLATFFLFLALAILQTSFFASLPGFFAYTPLVLASGVYLVQHAQERAGIYWIAGFGLFLDILAIPSFPLETASYAASGIAVLFSARHLFSNRSWYGLIACGIVAVLSRDAVRAVVLAAVSLQHPERVSWIAFSSALLSDTMLVVFLLAFFFAFAKPIRACLKAVFVLSSERDTL